MIPSEIPPSQLSSSSSPSSHFGEVPSVFQQAEQMLRNQLLHQTSQQHHHQQQQLPQLHPQQLRLIQNLQHFTKKVNPRKHLILFPHFSPIFLYLFLFFFFFIISSYTPLIRIFLSPLFIFFLFSFSQIPFLDMHRNSIFTLCNNSDLIWFPVPKLD